MLIITVTLPGFILLVTILTLKPLEKLRLDILFSGGGGIKQVVDVTLYIKFYLKKYVTTKLVYNIYCSTIYCYKIRQTIVIGC